MRMNTHACLHALGCAQFSTQHRCHPTEGRTCPLVALSDQVHAAVRKFMQPEFYNHSSVDVDGHHWNTSGHVDTSAGFFGTLLALHLCGEVRCAIGRNLPQIWLDVPSVRLGLLRKGRY